MKKKKEIDPNKKRYTKPVSWVVYEDTEGKFHAVLDNHVDTKQKVIDAGHIVRGYPSEKSAIDAATYIERLY